MVTDKNKERFERWFLRDYRKYYGKGANVDLTSPPAVDLLYEGFYNKPPEMKIGVFSKYYQETQGWILFVEPYSDKYRIVIKKFWSKYIYRADLITNAYSSAQNKLFEKANELVNILLEK